MKYNKILSIAAATVLMCGCADNAMYTEAPAEPGVTGQDGYTYLKSYVNRSENPNFKLGAGIEASDVFAHYPAWTVAKRNFDEVTPGNLMKFNSVVKDDGTMDFRGVTDFVNEAEAAGLTVYGHTLAWHSQQNKTYLNGILADKEIDADNAGNASVQEKPVTVKAYDFSGSESLGGWGMDVAPHNVNGVCEVGNNAAKSNPWDSQINCQPGDTYENGREYHLKMRVKGSAPFELSAGFQNPVSVSMPGIPQNAVSLTASGASVSSRGNGHFIVKPTAVGKDVTLHISGRDGKNMRNAGSFIFHVRKLPDPTAYISLGTDRFKGGGMGKAALMGASGIHAAIDDGLLDIPFRVVSFETVFFDNMGNAIPMASAGANFTDRQRDTFRKLSRNKRFYISHITAIGPDGITRKLPTAMEIIVK